MKKYFQRFSRIILSASTVMAMAVAILPQVAVYADSTADICRGVNLGDKSGCDSGTSGTKINNVLEAAINIFSIVVGFIAVLMVVVAGFKYITSGGDSNSVNSAKNTLLYAVVGLIIVALAQVIVFFVLARATKAPPAP